MVGGECEEFAACHLESAVAGYEKDGLFRFRQLRAHSGRQTESHGTEAAGGDELVGVLDFEMLRGEHLVLSDIGGTEIVFPFEQWIQCLNEEGSGILSVVFVHRRPGEDLIPPCGNVMRRGASFEHIDDGAHVTCDMNAAIYVFMEFSGVDIDMDDGLALAVRHAVARFSVIETAAQCKNDIRFGKRAVCTFMSVKTGHAKVLLAVGADAAEPHEGARAGEIQFLREMHGFILGTGNGDAAAHEHDRAFGFAEGIDGKINTHGIGGFRREGRELFSLVLDHGFLHIIRYIDQYRPRTSASGDLEGKMHGLFQLFRLIHKEILLRDRHSDAADVDFLKGIVSDGAALHLTGDGDDRDRVEESIRESGDEVRRPRAGGRAADTDSTARSGIAVGSVRCSLLMRGQYMADRCLIAQGIVEGEDSTARITENGRNAFCLEAFDHDFCTCQFHLIYLLQCHTAQAIHSESHLKSKLHHREPERRRLSGPFRRCRNGEGHSRTHGACPRCLYLRRLYCHR